MLIKNEGRRKIPISEVKGALQISSDEWRTSTAGRRLMACVQSHARLTESRGWDSFFDNIGNFWNQSFLEIEETILDV